jgi:microcystin-dependent protein
MADPFVAQIQILGCNFAPKGWAFCNGQLLPLSQNTALFSLLGTMYGGDGKSTFALPNLQGSVPVQQGQSGGTQLWDQGEEQGSDFVTLLTSEMPLHSHGAMARLGPSQVTDATNAVPGVGLWQIGAQIGVIQQYTVNQPNTQLQFNALAPNGGSLPHNNLMPYLALNYCIALQGIFPPRP